MLAIVLPRALKPIKFFSTKVKFRSVKFRQQRSASYIRGPKKLSTKSYLFCIFPLPFVTFVFYSNLEFILKDA